MKKKVGKVKIFRIFSHFINSKDRTSDKHKGSGQLLILYKKEKTLFKNGIRNGRGKIKHNQKVFLIETHKKASIDPSLRQTLQIRN